MSKPDMTEFDAARPRKPQSKVATILEEVTPERREALLNALHDPSYSNPTIAKVLKSWGYEISTFPVAEFRRNIGH